MRATRSSPSTASASTPSSSNTSSARSPSSRTSSPRSRSCSATSGHPPGSPARSAASVRRRTSATASRVHGVRGWSDWPSRRTWRSRCSGIGMPVVGWGWHERERQPSAAELVDRLGPVVEFVVDTFGAERCMFASNFPVDKVSYAWTDLFDAFAEIVAGRPVDEQRALFAETARRVYRL
ncbi:MAG: amidohydrolase family protein [Nitriliruptorales bacterium]|nr:amidohydrolase family protein [Nitriliruptorales bacterium]